MQLVLASNNRGKLDELQDLFAPLGVELVAQGTLGRRRGDEGARQSQGGRRSAQEPDHGGVPGRGG